ncbi:MAG: sugar nucleotide-binding protein, partial [Spirochaetes bacterium]|nr:sugar nucleotide-binding protein [Spirochaetota bacterium]
MVWLIGSEGMLGNDVEILLKEYGGEYVASDIEIDITDIDCLKKFINGQHIEWIINCAAYTAVDKAEEEPEKVFRLNADGA